MDFARNGTGGAFINYTFDFLRISAVNIYPGAFGRPENVRKRPETMPGVLTDGRVPIDCYIFITVASFH
jgi:hypothetical protein